MEPGRSISIEGQGMIRIQSESPYEYLDSNTAIWLRNLKQMWLLLRKCDATTQMLFDFFSKAEDPFKSALQIMMTCGDFYSGKQNSLAYNIMETFSMWLKVKKANVVYILSESLKLDAFNLVIRQKNHALVNLVINLYRMVEHKEIFIDSIKCLIANNRYKEACQCAVLLKLHRHFTLNDFLIPLVFQDKYAIAETFLESSKKHQIELAKFLDELLGKKNIRAEVEVIIQNLNINDAKVGRLYYKPLSKLVARIVKTFNLPSSVCPNLALKKGNGALQFLLQKRYIEKSIGGEGWAEMALEAVGDDPQLQERLVEGVALYGDLREALTWAEKLGVPEEAWPYKLREFSGRLSGQSSNSVWEENWDEPQSQSPGLNFHRLALPECQIALIDSASGFSNFLNDMASGICTVGFDAEWKPTFGLKKCDLALIQVATHRSVYILDVIALGSTAPLALWQRFAGALFGNPDILKLGFGLNEDLILMKDTLRKLHGIKTSDVGFLDLAVLWKVLVHDYDFAFPCASVADSRSSRGLSSLVELCLGEKLDKSDQFSNWENRPLRRNQILYAALDAFCLLEVYNVVLNECESQSIPISEVISDIMNEVASKSTEKKKKSPRGKWKGGGKPMPPKNCPLGGRI